LVDAANESPTEKSVKTAKHTWAVQLHHEQPGDQGHPSWKSIPFTTAEADEFATNLGFVNLGAVWDSEGYYLMEVEVVEPGDEVLGDVDVKGPSPKLRKRTKVDVEDDLLQSNHVRWFEFQVEKKRQKRNIHDDLGRFEDPLFPLQWHLFNDGHNGVYKGHDINVIPVWNKGINGSGVTVSVIDDGVQYDHPDIAVNWVEAQESSYDFNERTEFPMPVNPEDTHGTRCAGQIAAAKNSACGVGVAYGARIAGERLIADNTKDGLEARAFGFMPQLNHIYSASWGPPDDGASVDGPGTLAQQALEKGVTYGRNGRGSIYVFASGNGGTEGDNCNFDGYANSIYTISIGAITNGGIMPGYGEQCSAHLAVTYSGGNGIGIVTTDVDGMCTSGHSGTSAAAPLAAGMIALMLSVRPSLSWRDVQQLIVETAKQNDPTDPDWTRNGAGRFISHKYGFGELDATLLVDAAMKHELLPHPSLKTSKSHTANAEIPLQQVGVEGLDNHIDYTTDDLVKVGLASLEHVQVTVHIRHPERKHLTIILISPSGTSSVIAAPRYKDDSTEGFNPWTFMTVRCWGEDPRGRWTLRIQDGRWGDVDSYSGKPFEKGQLLFWQLTLHGTCAKEDVVDQDDDSAPLSTTNTTDRALPTKDRRRICSQTMTEMRRRRSITITIVVICAGAGFGFGLIYVLYRRYGTREGRQARYKAVTRDSDPDIESPYLLSDMESSPTRQHDIESPADSPIKGLSAKMGSPQKASPTDISYPPAQKSVATNASISSQTVVRSASNNDFDSYSSTKGKRQEDRTTPSLNLHADPQVPKTLFASAEQEYLDSDSLYETSDSDGESGPLKGNENGTGLKQAIDRRLAAVVSVVGRNIIPKSTSSTQISDVPRSPANPRKLLLENGNAGNGLNPTKPAIARIAVSKEVLAASASGLSRSSSIEFTTSVSTKRSASSLDLRRSDES
ncbi:Proprotein convertase subtilisin/kexin type 7, partial [Quaeritorhiza haematococci]